MSSIKNKSILVLKDAIEGVLNERLSKESASKVVPVQTKLKESQIQTEEYKNKYNELVKKYNELVRNFNEGLKTSKQIKNKLYLYETIFNGSQSENLSENQKITIYEKFINKTGVSGLEFKKLVEQEIKTNSGTTKSMKENQQNRVNKSSTIMTRKEAQVPNKKISNVNVNASRAMFEGSDDTMLDSVKQLMIEMGLG